ncbi:MAG: CHC2 zinc finger domain-containing protein [Eubacteriales bacterium]
MSVSILGNVFEVVKENVSTAEVAECYGIDVRRKCLRHVGACPFHNDKNPSFVVFPDGGWKCFGCGAAGGDAISLVAKILKISQYSAAVKIAEDFNIPVPNRLRPAERKEYEITITEKRLRRELDNWFKREENRVYQNLAAARRACDRLAKKIKTEDDLDEIGPVYHISEILDHALEMMRNGDLGDKRQIVRLGE